MEKTIGVLTFLLLMNFCSFGQIKKFKNQYNQFLGKGEKEILTDYHYMISEISDTHYIYRQFFPETKQLTDEKHFDSKNLKTLNGAYLQWYDDGTLITSGHFEKNIPSGHWQIFEPIKAFICEGEYERGKKNGLWKSYDGKGRLREDIFYVDGLKEGHFSQYDTLGTIINSGVYEADSIVFELNLDSTSIGIVGVDEMMPMLAGFEHISDYNERKKLSDEALLKHIYSSLKYPAIAREYNVEGRVIVKFVVDTLGAVSDIEVLKGLCASIKSVSQLAVSNLPRWNPGIQNGKAVKVQYILPISFKLQ